MGIAAAAPLGPRPAGILWAALTVCIFAGWFVVTRFAVTHTLRVGDIVVLRFGLGLLCLGPALLLSAPLPRHAWRNGALFAVLWGAPFVLLLGYGIQHTSAAEAAAIAPTLMPVFAGLFGWAVLRRPPGPLRLLGYAAILAGLVGMAAAIATAGSTPAGPVAWPDPLGLLALVAGAAMWAVYTLLFRNSGLTAIQSAALICFWSTLAFLPFYFALGLGRMAAAPWPELALQAGYQGVLMSAVGIVAFNRAVGLLGPGAASAIIALLPAIATAASMPVLDEVPGPAQLAALALIAAGVLLAARPVPATAP